jgi:hypothetical protein
MFQPEPALCITANLAANVADGSCMDGARGARGIGLSAKRSGAVMYSACCRLEDYLCRDAAAMAAGPDVIR